MLQSLSIKNVALIKSINIEFGKGLNILLGETGAGKSIIFDALNFVLGAKADKTLIRSGEKEMRVDAVFVNLSENTQRLLNEIGVEGEEISLSRTLNIDGKSIARINGYPAIQSQLKDVGAILVDSYSQHENTLLLKSKNHLSMLDKFAGNKISIIKNEVGETYKSYKEIENEILKFGVNDEFERERKLSLLEYQIKEIEEGHLKVGEDEQINERLNFFDNAEKIYDAVTACADALGGKSDSSLNQLIYGINSLNGLGSFGEIENCKERLESVKYEIEDVYETLKDIKASTEFDEKEFNRLDSRYTEIRGIIRKYGGSIENTLSYLDKAKEEYDALIHSEEILQKLNKEKDNQEKILLQKCEKLSEIRKEVAQEISDKILTHLKELGMKSSQFNVSFSKLSNFTSNGFDDIEFVFSANKGQEIKSLSKTASGGELSRFMLAFKNIFAEIGGAQTLIFDEIDAGISGETGIMVGQKLSNITNNDLQVICITHLPQVANYGDDFYFVSKDENDTTTETHVKHLEGDEVIYNLARMVVGDNVSQTALKQAEEMRSKSKGRA